MSDLVARLRGYAEGADEPMRGIVAIAARGVLSEAADYIEQFERGERTRQLEVAATKSRHHKTLYELDQATKRIEALEAERDNLRNYIDAVVREDHAGRADLAEAERDELRAQLAAIPAEHPRWPDGTPVAIGQRVRFNPADISEPVPYPCAECGDETPEDDLVGGMCCSGVCYGRMVGVLAGATEEASDDDPF